MKRNLWTVMALLLVVAMVLPACGGKGGTSKAGEPYKVAFVYIGPPGDLGWTYEHDRGRKALEEALGDKVETTYIENVEEGPDASRVIRQYAQEGYDMIFATSFGYMDYMYEVAQEFPDVKFGHGSFCPFEGRKTG